MGQQLILTIMDTLAISVFLIVLEFVEIAKLDTIMKTANTQGHKARKSAAACESSEDDLGLLTSEGESSEDDYPNWRLMLKNVEGNPELFKRTELQLNLNKIEKDYDPRLAQSCIEFDTGAENEEDPRKVRSFPTSPRAYREFDPPNFGNYGNNFDNVYAEARDPADKAKGTQFEDFGS